MTELKELYQAYGNHPRDAALLENFKGFVANLDLIEEEYEPEDDEDPDDYELKGVTYKKRIIKGKEWFVAPSDELPFHDFNIELGTEELGFGIRVDDDFFLVARLPYEFEDLAIAIIVNELWPSIKNPTFGRYSNYHFYNKQEEELSHLKDSVGILVKALEGLPSPEVLAALEQFRSRDE